MSDILDPTSDGIAAAATTRAAGERASMGDLRDPSQDALDLATALAAAVYDHLEAHPSMVDFQLPPPWDAMPQLEVIGRLCVALVVVGAHAVSNEDYSAKVEARAKQMIDEVRRTGILKFGGCVWCDATWMHDSTDIADMQAQAQAHAQRCANHPLRIERDQLREALINVCDMQVERRSQVRLVRAIRARANRSDLRFDLGEAERAAERAESVRDGALVAVGDAVAELDAMVDLPEAAREVLRRLARATERL